MNYFLGLTVCKLFACALLDAPWLVHVDVFRHLLDISFFTDRSRPDLVGLTTGGEWVAMESKGRVSTPTGSDRVKAKKQALRIITVRSAPVRWRIAGFAYFRNEALRFLWRDPQPEEHEPPNPVRLNISQDDLWQQYYSPVLDLLGRERALEMGSDQRPVTIEQADLTIRVAPIVLNHLLAERWSAAGGWCLQHRSEFIEQELHTDGIAIVAGESWSRPRQDSAE